MIGPLTRNQREYVLYHLELFVEMSAALKSHFIFGEVQPGKICFEVNEDAYDPTRVIWVEDLPILFPGNDKDAFYDLESGTLVFKHDLLKSAFYLLSAYREYESKEKDELGRFPYEASVQYELNIIDRPVVNEYFEIILKAMSAYCKYHGIELKQKHPDRTPSLFLTHDVDRIDKYTFHTVKGAFKKGKTGKAINWLFKWLNPLCRDNPKWTFDYLERTEQERDLHSCYFFLNRDVKHLDSYYSFQDKRIRELISHLETQGHMIGLHGGVRSSNDLNKIKDDLGLLNTVTQKKIKGNRQHRLLYQHPQTMRYLEMAGIEFDSTLGFAAHEGFRNSFCHPFKPYDLENDRMIDIWEIPLTVMDGTLFTYRGLTYEEAYTSIKKLKDEVLRHKGVFTLLFHQDFLDEEEHPGIRDFYERTLDLLTQEDMSVFNPDNLPHKG